MEESPAKIPAAFAHPSAIDSAEPRTPMGEVIIRFSRVKKRFGPKIVFSDTRM